ncbi:hypothetical protein ACE6H2_005831 [Prunus campanulata]
MAINIQTMMIQTSKWVGLMILEALVLKAMKIKPLVQIEASMEVGNEPTMHRRLDLRMDSRLDSTMDSSRDYDVGLGPQSGVHTPRIYKIGDGDKDIRNDDPNIEMGWSHDFGGFGARCNGDGALGADEDKHRGRKRVGDAFEVRFKDGLKVGLEVEFEVGYEIANRTMMKALYPKVMAMKIQVMMIQTSKWVGLMILDSLVLKAMKMEPLVPIEASMKVRNTLKMHSRLDSTMDSRLDLRLDMELEPGLGPGSD